MNFLATVTHTGQIKWWTGGYFKPGSYSGFYWFYSGDQVSFNDWADYEPSHFEDAAILAAMADEGQGHQWFTTSAQNRTGHPLCQL